jgi:hypothetical protein
MSKELSLNEIESKFEEEFSKALSPNPEQHSPAKIRSTAQAIARKLGINVEVTITCERPAGGRLKCKLNIKITPTL